MRRMIPQKLIDAIKHLAQSESEILSLAEKSTELLAIEDIMSITGGTLTIDADSVVDGDLGVTHTISANKVVEDGDTELIDLSSYINESFAKEHTLYAKLLVKHGLCTIIVSGKLIAGESASGNPIIISNFMNAIPAAIKAKIYRNDGTNLSQSASSSTFIDRIITMVSVPKYVAGSFNNTSLGVLSSIDSDTLTLGGYSFGTIAEDASVVISVRMTLTI